MDQGFTLETLNVFKIAELREVNGLDNRPKFDLKLNEQEFDAWKVAAKRQGIGSSDLIHTITVFGYHNLCQKKTAMLSAASAFISDPNKYENEKAYYIDFERLIPNCKCHEYGDYITSPYKRYGKWFINEYPRYRTGSDLGGGARLTSLALQRTTGAVYMTNEEEFSADRAANAASGLVLMRDINQTSINKLPIIGFRRGKQDKKTFKEEFFSTDGLIGNAQVFQYETKIMQDTYQPLDNPFIYESQQIHQDEFYKSPWMFYMKHKNANYGSKEYDLINNYGNYVKAIGDLMLTVSGNNPGITPNSISKRVVTINGLESLLRTTIPWLNSINLDTKRNWQLVASDICRDASKAIINDESNNIISTMVNGYTLNSYYLQSDQVINDRKDQYQSICLNKLQLSLSVLWGNIQDECIEAFNQEFNVFMTDVEKQRLSKQMLLERNARIAAENQLNSINWFFRYWKEIIFSIGGCWIGWKLLKCLKCCANLFNTNNNNNNKKLVAELEKTLKIKEKDDGNV